MLLVVIEIHCLWLFREMIKRKMMRRRMESRGKRAAMYSPQWMKSANRAAEKRKRMR